MTAPSEDLVEQIARGKCARIADELLKLAARRSTETSFGWSHPDCEALQEAARILKGEPLPTPSDEVVLSDAQTERLEKLEAALRRFLNAREAWGNAGTVKHEDRAADLMQLAEEEARAALEGR